MLNSAGRNRPYIIAIANEKGGVGKTTSTLAIGTIMTELGHKVLVIDMDPQGNLTLALGFNLQDMPTPNFGLGTGGTVLARESFRTENENLDLVYARNLIIDNQYRLKVNSGKDAHSLSQTLKILQRLPYDFVIIDCPPSMTRITMHTLLVSDFLIIPTQAEFFSAIALKEMMEMIGLVRQNGNPGLRYRILITLFDQRNRVHHSIKNQLSRTFIGGIFETIISVNADLRKTAILGFPSTNTRGVRQYRALVDELLKYIEQTEYLPLDE